MKKYIYTTKKYIITVLIYFIIALIIWNIRKDILYSHIPSSIMKMQYTHTVLDIIILNIGFIGLICLIGIVHCPPHLKRQVKIAVERAELHNGKGEYPILLSVSDDVSKLHGKVYNIKNMGISLKEFKEKSEKLTPTLGGVIYEIDFGRTTNITRLYILPYKYKRPSLISINDESLSNEPNFLVVGKTGSGKSYALYVLLGIYAKYTNASITVCDYKKSSFANFEDIPNFYGYTDVIDGVKEVYKEFCNRLKTNDDEINGHIKVLIIDEYGALISSQDKKTADELKTMVGNMLFMGRSLGIRVIIGVQRADAEYFKAGARDQFHAILGLGNLSQEQKRMLFADYKDKMTERVGIGEGYLLIEGRRDIEHVKVATIKSFDTINANIRKAMSR